MPQIHQLPPVQFWVPPTCYIEPPYSLQQIESKLGKSDYCWTLQTFIHLQELGYPCTLVSELPTSGVLIAHRSSLPFRLEPSEDLLIVAIKADYDWHPYAQLQIVQNAQEINETWNSHFIPLWTQTGIIPRDPERGDRFENIRYYGISYNLAPELKHPEFKDELHNLGLNWQIVREGRWHDYSETDAVIAVRDFTGLKHNHKPASKLFNAWHAGVPVILSPESAYRAERLSELDYIEVKTRAETILALKNLRDNVELQRHMIANAQRRRLEVSTAAIAARWVNFLNQVAIPTYYRWRSLPRSIQRAFVLTRKIGVKQKGAIQRIIGRPK